MAAGKKVQFSKTFRFSRTFFKNSRSIFHAMFVNKIGLFKVLPGRYSYLSQNQFYKSNFVKILHKLLAKNMNFFSRIGLLCPITAYLIV